MSTSSRRRERPAKSFTLRNSLRCDSATYHDATGPAGPPLFLHGTFYGAANYSNSVFTLVVTP